MTRSQDRFKYSTLQTNPINSNQLYNKKFQVNFQMPSHIQNLMQNVSNYGNIQKNQSPKHYHFIQTIQKQSQSVQFQQQENRSRPFSQFQYNIVQQGNQERLKSLPDENDSKDINKNLNQPKKVNQMIRNQKNEQIKNSNFQIQKLKQQLSQINIKEYLKKSVVLKTPSNLIEIQKSMQNRMKQFSQQNDQNHNETDYDLESARSNISSNQINSNNRQIFSKHIKNNTLDYNINKQISVQFDKNDDSQEYYQQLQDKLSFLENKMKSIKQNIIQQDKLHLKRAASQDLQLNTTENKNNFFNKYEIQQQNKKKRDLDKRFQELLQNLPYKSKNQVSQKSFDFLNDQELKEWKEKFVPKDGITKKTIEFIKQEIQKSKESDNTKENQNPSILQSFITQQSQQSQIDTKPKILNKSIESSSQLILNLQQSLKNTKQRNQICSQNLKIMQQKDSVQRQDYYLTKVCNSVKNNIQNEFYDHFIQTIQAIQYSYTVKQPNSLQIQEKSIDLKQQVKYQGKKTLIFDLDETLIHCMDQKHDQSQIVLSIQFDNGDIVKAGINIRPYAIECIRELSQYYEIIVFTASHASYANIVLDYLDPQKEYISHRLYRESCIYTDDGIYIKDLRIIKNRKLENMIIIDNAAYSFSFQVIQQYNQQICNLIQQIDNGIPILGYYNDDNDQELNELMKFLKQISDYDDDIRIKLREVFKLSQFKNYSDAMSLVEKLFANK